MSQLIPKPINMAIVKLANVPMSTYSVILISLALFSSPKRKTDFAANKNPIPSILSVNMKVRISILSRYPIHLPALGKPCDEVSDGIHFSYSIKDFIKMEVGASTAMYVVAMSQKFEDTISSAISN